MQILNSLCPNCGARADFGRERFDQDFARQFHGNFDIVFCTKCKKVVGTLMPFYLQCELETFLQSQKT
ncbi:MAG: hypothetical protein AB7T74_04820 [Clostridia bacterium]